MLYKPGITEHTYAIYAGDYRAYVRYISPGLKSIRMLYKPGITEHTYALYSRDYIAYVCSIRAALHLGKAVSSVASRFRRNESEGDS